MPSEQKIIVIPDGKICDYIDGKFRNDTPEEYVRQTIEKRLVNEHKYLPEQIRIEYTLQVGSNKTSRRHCNLGKRCRPNAGYNQADNRMQKRDG